MGRGAGRAATSVALVVAIGALVAAQWARDPGGSSGHEDAAETAPRTARARAAAAARRAPRAPGALEIRGRVVDAVGPVAGARVVVEDPSWAAASASCGSQLAEPLLDSTCANSTAELAALRSAAPGPLGDAITAADGTFALRALPVGRFSVAAEHPSRGVALAAAVEAGGPEVELRLEPGARIEGVVRDEDDAAIAAASITAIHRLTGRAYAAASARDGTFRVGPLPHGAYAVLVEHEAHLPERAQVSAGGALLEVRLWSPATVAGLVLLDGRPAAGAEIVIESWTDRASTRAGRDGRFTAGGLRVGAYEITATLGEHGAMAQAFVEAGMRAEVEIELATLFALEGTVRDPDGAPIAGAAVVVTRSGLHAGQVVLRAATGADGRYRLRVVPDTWSVMARAEGFLAGEPSTVVLVAARGEPYDLTLEPGARVAGVVVDAAGAPVADARLISGENEATSRSDGSFALAVEPGPFELVAEHQEHRPARVAGEAPTEGLRVVLSAGARVRGVLLDAAGAPVARAAITAHQGDERAAAGFDVTRSDGGFELTGLAGGEHDLRALVSKEDRSRRGARALVTVPERGLLDGVVLRLGGGAPIGGVVVDATGAPVPSVAVLAYEAPAPHTTRGEYRAPSGLGGEMLRAVGDAEGRFSIEAPRDAQYLLSVDGALFTQRGLVRARPGDRDVRLVVARRASVRGRVVDREGRPIAAFAVDTHPYESADGTFQHAVDRDFASPLVVTAYGYGAERRPVEPRAGEVIDLGDIALAAGRKVRGRVIDGESGAPLAGARLMLDRGVAPEELRHASEDEEHDAITDSAGRFSLSDLGAHDTHVVVSHPAYATTVATLPGGEASPTLRIAPNVRVRGRLRGRTGEPIAGRILAEDIRDRRAHAARAGEDGAFELRLSPGTYQLRAWGDAPFLPETVVVAAGREIEVELRASPGGRVRLRVVPGSGRRGEQVLLLLPGRIDPASLGPQHLQRQLRGESAEGRETVYPNVPAGEYSALIVEEGPGPTYGFVVRPLTVGGEAEQSFELSFTAAELRPLPGH